MESGVKIMGTKVIRTEDLVAGKVQTRVSGAISSTWCSASSEVSEGPGLGCELPFGWRHELIQNHGGFCLTAYEGGWPLPVLVLEAMLLPTRFRQRLGGGMLVCSAIPSSRRVLSLRQRMCLGTQQGTSQKRQRQLKRIFRSRLWRDPHWAV